MKMYFSIQNDTLLKSDLAILFWDVLYAVLWDFPGESARTGLLGSLDPPLVNQSPSRTSGKAQLGAFTEMGMFPQKGTGFDK